jgi:hypothetical protein
MTDPRPEDGPFHSTGLPYHRQRALEREGLHSLDAIYAADDEILTRAGLTAEEIGSLRSAVNPVFTGLSDRLRGNLTEAGFANDAALAAASDDDLSAVAGLGSRTLEGIRSGLRDAGYADPAPSAPAGSEAAGMTTDASVAANIGTTAGASAESEAGGSAAEGEA